MNNIPNIRKPLYLLDTIQKEKYLEIAIFDDGLTIPLVFEENNINYSKDGEAIRMALEGKTTKKEDISRGYGLEPLGILSKH